MTPMQVMQAATVNIARAYRVDDELGSIAPGKRADPVALDRDPLTDVENMRTVSLVVKDGQIIDRSALPSHRLLDVVGCHLARQHPDKLKRRQIFGSRGECQTSHHPCTNLLILPASPDSVIHTQSPICWAP